MAIGSTFSAIEATFGNPVYRNERTPPPRPAEFVPPAPKTLAETGLAPTDIEARARLCSSPHSETSGCFNPLGVGAHRRA